MKRWLLPLFMIIGILLTARPINSLDLGKLGDILGKGAEVYQKVKPLTIDNNQIGLLFTQGVEKQYGLDQNPQRQARVQTIGSKILAANRISGKYDFAVLATHDFNAYSIYGGHIRVNEGLLYDTQNNDTEAAFAIAHEIAHNELGHNKEAVRNFKIAYASELTNLRHKLPQLLVAGANAAVAKRSRENERDADYKALELMSKAGFKPTGAIAMARRIEAEHKIAQKRAGQQSLVTQRFNAIFDTHPDPARRAEMAEDFYFQQKYGKTFKQIAGDSTSISANSNKYNPTTGDLPIIVAHPSLWNFKLSYTNMISGVGIFNPSPLANEDEDVNFYLDVLEKGNLVAVTADNDSHGWLGKETDRRFTFIQGDYADPSLLIKAIKLGQTYASRDGTEIQNMNFPIGQNYPKVNFPHLTFKLVFEDSPLVAPSITVFRDRKLLGSFRSNRSRNREASYTIDDRNVGPGRHWYVLRVKGVLITSPITLTVTRNPNDTFNPGGSSNWQKGCIHFHSFYSDGLSKSIQDIWNSAPKHSVGFIFMTDHADSFTDAARKHQTNRMYESYVGDCERASPAMVPGVEYPLGNVKESNHILILNLRKYLPYKKMSEDEFFTGKSSYPNQVPIIRDQFHIGDDQSQTEMVKDATFDFSKSDATLKLWIKGSPFKDPIIWVNRYEVGRVVTTDNQWHLFTFQVPAQYLRNGQNLFHIESFIPDRWHTFDDCEVKDVWILPNTGGGGGGSW